MEMGLGEQAAKVYRLLGRAYLQPPDCPYLEDVSAWCAELLAQRDSLPEGIAAALALIRGALEPEPGADRLQLQELQQEHARLFRGLSPRHSPPPPYESVYREGRLWGSVTAAVRRLYRQWGLEPGGDFCREPPDHLGLELQFMGHLCSCEQLAAQAGGDKVLRAQRAFLEEHLAWFGAFEARVLLDKPHPFYEGFLRLTGAWLKLHREYLEEVFGPEA